MSASYISRWNWVGRTVVYIWWICWITAYFLGDGTNDFRGNPFAGDHRAFYQAAQVIHDAEKSSKAIYPAKPEDWHGALPFRNPPFYALLYYPTAGMPYIVSAIIWDIVSLLALGLGIYWLRPARYWRTWWYSLGFYPVLLTMIYGQNSLLSFAVFALTFRLLEANRLFVAGLVAGLLAYKPTLLTGLVFWALLDIRRLWRCAAGAVITTIVLCLGSYAIIPDAWHGFITTMPENLRFDEHSVEWWKNQVPKGFWKALLPTSSDTIHSILTWLCTLAGLAWFVLIWLKRRLNLAVMFGAAIVMTLWTSAHALTYEWSLLVIPSVIWWERLPEIRDRLVVPFTAVWLALLISMDLCWVHRYLLDFPVAALPQFLIAVPVVAWAGWRIMRILVATPTLAGNISA